MSRAASLLAAPADAAVALAGGACGVCPIACAQLRNLYGSLVLSFTIVFMNTKSCDSDSECSHPCHSRARFTTLSQAPRSPRSHYLLLPLPVLARDTRQSSKVPARKLLLGLFKGNMIQCQPPEEGCSERQCAVAPEQHIKDAQPNTGTQGSGVGESGTYTFATLARSDHCSPCPCPAVCVSPRTTDVPTNTKQVARSGQLHGAGCTRATQR